MRVTEADRKLMKGIDLGPRCLMCEAHEAREIRDRETIDDLSNSLMADRLTIADQGETIDRLVKSAMEQRNRFHLALFAIGLIFVIAIAARAMGGGK